MTEIFTAHNAALLVPLTAIIGGCLMGLVAVVALQWRRVRVAEIEPALKQQMIERGMAPGEIEQVLRATRDESEEVQLMRVENAHKAGYAARAKD